MTTTISAYTVSRDGTIRSMRGRVLTIQVNQSGNLFVSTGTANLGTRRRPSVRRLYREAFGDEVGEAMYQEALKLYGVR